MSEQTFDHQVVTQYLLGSLPEAERVRLDELSFTDDDFAEALGAAEKDLVDAYVQGELTGAALEQFKSYYLASPLRREKVKFAQVFQVFADQSVSARVAAVPAEGSGKSATEGKGAGWFSGLGAFFAPRSALQWGLTVAALAFLFTGTWLVFENMRLRQQMSQTQARREELLQREKELQKELEGQRSASATVEQELARVREERQRLEQELNKRQASSPTEPSIVSFTLAPQLRGAGQIPIISIPARTDYVAMQLGLEPNDYQAYRVALVDQANKQTLWNSGTLSARATEPGKTLSVRFSAGLLKPQTYFLRVTGLSPNGASEIIGDYPFRVMK